ncbi:hypothetical protein D3C87_1511340 [compost metagenome]
MGWTDVQRNILIIQHVTRRTRFVIEVNWQRSRANLVLIRIVVFTKRMTHELVVSQNLAKIRMTFENNTEHVVSFALKPVRTTVSVDRRPDRLAFTHLRFDTQT